MNKYGMILLMFLVLILSSCESNISSLPPDSNPTENNDSENSVSEEPESSLLPTVFKGGVYVNDELGFQLTFPESWENYYTIDWEQSFANDIIKECIRISFYGESDISKEYDEKYDMTRIPLFYICTETFLESRGGQADQVVEIGHVGDRNFYKFSDTHLQYHLLPERRHTG
jgi:hypothetical protein